MNFADTYGSLLLILRSDADISDTSGNALVNTDVVGVNEGYIYDAVPPTVTISSSESFPTNATSIPLTFTFSESVNDFGLEDIFLVSGGGSFSALSGSGTTYTANFTPSGEGLSRIGVTSGGAEDAAGNGNTASETFDITTDWTRPGVSLTAPGKATGPYTVVVRFGEPVIGLEVTDFLVTGGGASALTSTGATTYDLLIVPTVEGNVAVSLPEGTTTDAAGNFTYGVGLLPTFVDSIPPGVVLSGNPPQANGPFPLTITFSEPVTGFGLGAIGVVNGSVSALTQNSPTQYDVTITPLADGAVLVDVVAGQFSDTGGLQNTAPNQASTIADLTAPTLTLSTPPTTTNAPYAQTFTFSEDVTGFSIGDITTVNASASDFTATSPSTYTATITPTSDGAFSVSVAAGVAEDLAGNLNTAVTPVGGTIDLTGPTVVLGAPPAMTSAPYTQTFSFSEDVTGFTIDDITTVNASASDFLATSAASYSATITPTSSGTFSVSVAEGAAEDASGNLSLPSVTLSGVADFGAPSVTLTGMPDFPGTPYTLTITFSEAVTGLEPGDFTLNNATLSGLAGSGAAYTVQVTSSDFTHSVLLPANRVQDATGNGNTASNRFRVAEDGTAAALVISGLPETFQPGDTLQASFTFSEAVSGFDLPDISVSGGTASGLSGGPVLYTATITPDGDRHVTVAVADGAARDVTGTPTTGATAKSRIDSAGQTSKMISSFMETRARSLVQNQPSVMDFVTSKRQGQFSASLSRGTGDFVLHSRADSAIWFSVVGSKTTSDTEEMTYGLAVAGTHLTFANGAILGAMLQYDVSEQTADNGAVVRGHGPLVGPYFATQLGAQPVYLSGRVLYGTTTNEISPFGTYTDSFEGDRLLATLNLEGRHELPGGTFVAPKLSYSHVSETQDAYVDSLSNEIPEQTIGLSEVSLDADFEVPIPIKTGEMWFDWGMSYIHSDVSGSGAASAYAANTSGGRGRVDGGLRYNDGSRFSTFVKGYVDGLGSSGSQRTLGGSVGFEVAF
ncbi:Ig-like domain-containing protein [Oceanibium sediminis]|uniref:Ig-like domain-containing protein n=1 Tax=Oceanibium sediminis TaxID=2026339 RepID=UPI001300966F|nr:Ig-like domain-containing protein [Oceanibium sediminis]